MPTLSASDLSPSSFAEWASTIHTQLQHESKHGGELTGLPCPFCHLPRCQRSDYIRCQHCGVNWLAGEDLNHNPSIERHDAYLKSIRDMPKGTPQRH
jgi:hypothetical protein